MHVKLFARVFLLLTVWSHLIGFQESGPMAIHYVHRVGGEQLWQNLILRVNVL